MYNAASGGAKAPKFTYRFLSEAGEGEPSQPKQAANPSYPFLIILVCVTAIIPSAWAGPISLTTLFNTGVANDGTRLADGAVDPHYSLTLSPDPNYPGPAAFAGHVSLWVANTSTSKWIGPDPSFDYVASGNYIYRTTFYLPQDFDPNKDVASITGVWATDNTGIDILINGVSTGNSIPYGEWGVSESWRTLSSLSINTGFAAGLNTLDFVIWNEGCNTGLQARMTGSYTIQPSPVPEPSELLLCIGLGAVGLVGWRWK